MDTMPDRRSSDHTQPTPSPKISLKRALATVTLLNLSAGTVLLGALALTSALGLDMTGSYTAEVAGASVSLTSLALYAGGLAIYATGIEAFLRLGIQRPVMGKLGVAAGLTLAAATYAACHLHHSVPSAFYALGVGLVTAGAFAKGTDWKLLALWHIQWDWIAIASVLFLATLGPGPERQAINLAYKTHQVEQGRLIHRAGWGWIDQAHHHGAQKRLCQTLNHLSAPTSDKLTLTAAFERVDGSVLRTHTTYHINTPISPHARRATAAAIVMDAATMDEQTQQDAPWWTALQLSAWSFEDLSSVQRAALDALQSPNLDLTCASPARPTYAPPSLALLKRWEKEGPALTATPKRDFALPAHATPGDHNAQNQIDSTKALWRRVRHTQH